VEKVAVIVGPRLLGEMQLSLYMKGDERFFLVGKKKESYWGATGAMKLPHLS